MEHLLGHGTDEDLPPAVEPDPSIPSVPVG